MDIVTNMIGISLIYIVKINLSYSQVDYITGML